MIQLFEFSLNMPTSLLIGGQGILVPVTSYMVITFMERVTDTEGVPLDIGQIRTRKFSASAAYFKDKTVWGGGLTSVLEISMQSP